MECLLHNSSVSLFIYQENILFTNSCTHIYSVGENILTDMMLFWHLLGVTAIRGPYISILWLNSNLAKIQAILTCYLVVKTTWSWRRGEKLVHPLSSVRVRACDEQPTSSGRSQMCCLNSRELTTDLTAVCSALGVKVIHDINMLNQRWWFL